VSIPLPPSDLASRKPELIKLRAGTIIHRFFTSGYEPIFFDSGPSGRLNAPDGSYGVLYCAKEPSGAFAETFLRSPGRN
jgi:RES domain